MADNLRLNLIAQICEQSSLSGKALDDLKARLEKLSEAELNAELQRLLTGNIQPDNTGLVVERTTAVNPPKTALPTLKKTSKDEFQEAQAKEAVIGILDNNIAEAEAIQRAINLGNITEAYDDLKGENNKTKISNVEKVISYQRAGLGLLVEAKNNKLSKRDYYLKNVDRIKEMILTRLYVLETSSGVKYIDLLKDDYSEEKIKEIIDNHINFLCSDMNLKDLKDFQRKFVSLNSVDEAEFLAKLVQDAKNSQKANADIQTESSSIKLNAPKSPVIPQEWNSEELITFEEAYKLERGVDYTQFAIENYNQTKAELGSVIGAFNKKQEFIGGLESILEKEGTTEEKSNAIIEFFNEFYAMNPLGGTGELNKLIKKSGLPISLENGKLDLSVFPDEAAQGRTLISLVKLAKQEKEKDFQKFLGEGKTIEDYQEAHSNAYNHLLGEDDAKLLAEAMDYDVTGAIEKYTGKISSTGMALTMAGGAVLIVPTVLAASGVAVPAFLTGATVTSLAAGAASWGGTAALSGMVAKNGLGIADYKTKEYQSDEEAAKLTKGLILDAGGFVVGMAAGKVGMKAFRGLIDEKLAVVFKEQITNANRVQAFKTVLTNPQYLSSFMKATGVKISADFLISFVGDLAMMGILDTGEDWKSLLRANLIGIAVGMAGDIKDISGAGGNSGTPRAKVKGNKKHQSFDVNTSLKGSEVTAKSRSILETALSKVQRGKRELDKEFLDAIPDEYSAQMIIKYMQKNAFYEENYRVLRSLDSKDLIEAFVECLEDPNMGDIPLNNLRAAQAFETKDEYITFLKSGYLKASSSSFDYPQYEATMKIEDPQRRERLCRMNGSKLFKNCPWHELYELSEHVDLSKLDKIESMMDPLNWNDNYSIGGINTLLDLTDSELSIIEKRGLLKDIEGREKKVDLAGAIKLAQLNATEWDNVQKRGLLLDFEIEGSNGTYKSRHDGNMIAEFAKLSDSEWSNVETRNLFSLKDTSYDNVAMDDYLVIQLARVDDAQYEEFLKLKEIPHPTRNKDGKTRFSILECFSYIMQSEEVKSRIESDKLFEQQNGSFLSMHEILTIAAQDGETKSRIENILAKTTSSGHQMFTVYEAKNLANLSPEEFKLIEARHLMDEFQANFSWGESTTHFSGREIMELIKIPDDIWAKMEASNCKKGGDKDLLIDLSKMSEEQWNRAFESKILPYEGNIELEEILTVTALDEKSWQRYLTDFLPEHDDIKIIDSVSPEILALNDVEYERFKQIMFIDRNGVSISASDVLEFVKCPDEQWNRIITDLYLIENVNTQFSCSALRNIAALDEKAYGRASEIIKRLELMDWGSNGDSLISIAKLEDTAYEKIKPYISSVAETNTLKDLLKISELPEEKINMLMTNQILLEASSPMDVKLKILDLPEDKFKEIITIIQKNEHHDYSLNQYLKLAELEPEKYEICKALLLNNNVKRGFSIGYGNLHSRYLEKITPKVLERFENDIVPLIKDAENPKIAYELGKLLDILTLPDDAFAKALERLKYLNSVENNVYQVDKVLELSDRGFKRVKQLCHIEELGDKQLGNGAIIRLADETNVSEKQFERFFREILPMRNSLYSSNADLVISKLALLSEDDFNRIKPYIKKIDIYSENNIDQILEFTPEDLQIIDSRHIPNSTGKILIFNLVKLIELSEEDYQTMLLRAEELPHLSDRGKLETASMPENEYKIVKEYIEFFTTNIDRLKQADLDVNAKSVSNLIFDSREGVNNVLDIIGAEGLKHTLSLRYKGLDQFLNIAKRLSSLTPEMKTLLKEKLAKLPHPEQKINKLEIIAALVNNIKDSSLKSIIEKIDSPEMTQAQKDMVNRIFATDKPYSEQIEDFIIEFDVPNDRQDAIRKFLEAQNLNKKYITPPSIENQLAIIDKKIASIERNDKIPAEKKSVALNQLRAQREDIINNPERYSQPRINDNVFKPLEAQVEAHINLPNQNKAFSNAINREFYSLLGFKPTDELISAVDFDSKYISKLFIGASSYRDFKDNFKKVIKLIEENPDKNFTEIIKTLPQNLETETLFKKQGLDYERWMKFDPQSKHEFQVEVNIDRAVEKAKTNLLEEFDSELLRKLDSDEVAKIKNILTKYDLENPTQKDLGKIIKDLEAHIESSEYWKQNDDNIKTFVNHIKTTHKKAIHDLNGMSNGVYNLEVRLWDKDDVGRNIFFGNHVGCCTSVGSGSNSFAAPQHLINSFVNGIEIVDKSGNSYGNSMCYFAEVDGKLTFVIDSFEANGKLGAEPVVTEAIIAYAKQVCTEMGRPDMQIMFGPNFNKLDFSSCKKTQNHTIQVVGNASETTYIDALGGKASVNNPAINKTMIELNPDRISQFLNLFDDKKIAEEIMDSITDEDVLNRFMQTPEVFKEFVEVIKAQYSSKASGKTIGYSEAAIILQILSTNIEGELNRGQIEIYKEIETLSKKPGWYDYGEIGTVLNTINDSNYKFINYVLERFTKDNEISIPPMQLQKYAELTKDNPDVARIAREVISNDYLSNSYYVSHTVIIDIIEKSIEYPDAFNFIQEAGLPWHSSIENIHLMLEGGKKQEIYLDKLNEEQVNFVRALCTKGVPEDAINNVYFQLGLREINPKDYDLVLKLADKCPKMFFSGDRWESNGQVLFNFILLQDKSLLEFIISDSFEAELKKNSAGKFQNELLEMINPKNFNSDTLIILARSGLTKEELLNAVKKMSKSTFKLAYETPNQYLADIDLQYTIPQNGKLPKLSDEVLAKQRNDVQKFFLNNLGKLAKVLNYIDTDTISHFMDKRTTIFAKFLNDMMTVDKDSMEALSKALQCKSSLTGKNLSPKEKMQICQIYQIFASAKLDRTALDEQVAKGEFNIKLAKDEIKKAIIRDVDIDISSLDITVDEVKLNEDYSYLLLLRKQKSADSILESPEFKNTLSMLRQQVKALIKDEAGRKQAISQSEAAIRQFESQISNAQKQTFLDIIEALNNIEKYTEEQIFDLYMKNLRATFEFMTKSELTDTEVVVRSIIQNNFEELINDPNTPYGKANAETQRLFEEIGLNFDKWMSPEIKPHEFSVAGRDLKIQLWDRNPQEDLFMGNKTTCCTGIGEGNAAATPIYLLNKSFNVVHLYDSKGNVVGMSRVFMGIVDGRPSLMMDNIELNGPFTKGLSEEEIRSLRNGFFEYMKKYAPEITGETDTPVYYYSGDTKKVPTGDLDSVIAETTFIGDLSAETVYVNSSGCRWVDPRKLHEERDIVWLIAE